MTEQLLTVPSEQLVVRGDCTYLLHRVPDGCVDAVITDPPYGIAYDPYIRIDGQPFPMIDNDEQPYIWWLAQAARVMKPQSCLLCFCRWDTAEAFRLAIGWAGLKVRSQIIWDRERIGMGDTTATPGPQHDTIWFATKGKYQLPGNTKRPCSVVRHQKVMDCMHPNEKPVPLMVELVETYVPADGSVLDPFAGSGTTGVACAMSGRQFLGMELSEKYFKMAQGRIADARPLFGKAA